MTVTRTYQCNLCGANGNGEPLRGVYFEQQVTKEKLVEKPWRQVEHHICNKCLDDLREFPQAQSLANKTGWVMTEPEEDSSWSIGEGIVFGCAFLAIAVMFVALVLGMSR